MLSSIMPIRLMLLCILLLSCLFTGSVVAQTPGLQTYYVSFKPAPDGVVEGTGQFLYDPTVHEPTDPANTRRATLTIISFPARPELVNLAFQVTVDSVKEHDPNNQGPSRVRGITGTGGTSTGLLFSVLTTGSSRGTWLLRQFSPTGLITVDEGAYLIRNQVTVPESPAALLLLAGILPVLVLKRRRLRRS